MTTASPYEIPDLDLILEPRQLKHQTSLDVAEREPDDPRLHHTQAVFNPLPTIECHARFFTPFTGIRLIPQGEVLTIKVHRYPTRHSDKSKAGPGNPNVEVIEEVPPFIVAQKVEEAYGTANRLTRTKPSGLLVLWPLTGYASKIHDMLQLLALPVSRDRTGRGAVLKMERALRRRVGRSLEEMGEATVAEMLEAYPDVAGLEERARAAVALAIETIRKTPANEYTKVSCEESIHTVVRDMHTACETAIAFAKHVTAACRTAIENYMATGKGFGEPDEFELSMYDQLEKEPPELSRDTNAEPKVISVAAPTAAPEAEDLRPKKQCFMCAEVILAQARKCRHCGEMQPEPEAAVTVETVEEVANPVFETPLEEDDGGADNPLADLLKIE